MEAPVLPKRVYRFGLFQLDPDNGKLLRQGVSIKVHDQPFRVLCQLLERPGEVVTREQLRQSLWPEGTYVEFDGSLNAAVKKLRIALGDDADNPIFIETLPKRGYRFLAPVASEQLEEVSAAANHLPIIESPALQTGDEYAFPRRRVLRLRWILVAVAIAVSIAGWQYARRPLPTSAPKVIAVLPFSNEGAGPNLDYLRYAIANDLVTDLTYARSITVRPFASTTRYVSQSADPEAIGKELRVTHVVAGGFLLQDRKLRVDLELINVAQNQPVWRDEIIVSPPDLITLHEQLALRAAQGMLPSINAVAASLGEIPAPKNEQAVQLFVQALAIPLDPEPNRVAIRDLEQSVSLDPGYAPAWAQLAWRYYIEYHYGNGSEVFLAKSLEAYQRQSQLDPSQPPVSTTLRTEQGDLNGSYDQAADYVRRRPSMSLAHFWMSYVLRYAGLLEEAGKECDAALAIDAGFNVFRSCAKPFIFVGDYAHAQTYIRLDENSGFAAYLRMMIALRMGNTRAALAETEAVSRADPLAAKIVRLYLSHAPEAELIKAAAAIESDPKPARDPEELFGNAEILSLSGQSNAALRQLRKAIRGNYCSYPAMDTDPLFDPIRRFPEFAELHQAAIQCQASFLVHRDQAKTAAQATATTASRLRN